MKKLIYYAHPVSDYDTLIEAGDIQTLEQLGFEVFNPNNQKHTYEYGRYGMGYFLNMISECDAVAFRTFPGGELGAAVAKEVRHGINLGLPVFELGSFPRLPVLTVEQTRSVLKNESA